MLAPLSLSCCVGRAGRDGTSRLSSSPKSCLSSLRKPLSAAPNPTLRADLTLALLHATSARAMIAVAMPSRRFISWSVRPSVGGAHCSTRRALGPPSSVGSCTASRIICYAPPGCRRHVREHPCLRTRLPTRAEHDAQVHLGQRDDNGRVRAEAALAPAARRAVPARVRLAAGSAKRR